MKSIVYLSILLELKTLLNDVLVMSLTMLFTYSTRVVIF